MKAIRQAGFTLWELLVTLLVAGVLFSIGVPNMMEFQRNGVMSGAANELVTALLVARSEAIKRQSFVTWCLSTNPTAAAPTCAPGPIADSATSGFIVWMDENGNVDVETSQDDPWECSVVSGELCDLEIHCEQVGGDAEFTMSLRRQ